MWEHFKLCSSGYRKNNGQKVIFIFFLTFKPVECSLPPCNKRSALPCLIIGWVFWWCVTDSKTMHLPPYNAQNKNAGSYTLIFWKASNNRTNFIFSFVRHIVGVAHLTFPYLVSIMIFVANYKAACTQYFQSFALAYLCLSCQSVYTETNKDKFRIFNL